MNAITPRLRAFIDAHEPFCHAVEPPNDRVAEPPAVETALNPGAIPPAGAFAEPQTSDRHAGCRSTLSPDPSAVRSSRGDVVAEEIEASRHPIPAAGGA